MKIAARVRLLGCFALLLALIAFVLDSLSAAPASAMVAPAAPPMLLYLGPLTVIETEDNGEDELYLKVNGKTVWEGTARNGRTINDIPNKVGPIPFYDNVKIALMEEDWPDPDDVLGELYVYTSGNRSPATFTRDGAHYELQYGVLAARSSFECDGAPGVYLYVHSDYRGNCTKFTEDFFNIRHFAIGNDTASSIRIVGCYNAELYEHSQYQGDSSAFHRDDPNLRNDKIGTDRTTSLRIRPCP